MVKEIFQYAFDIIRNLSLIIVVIQIIALLSILNMEHTRESIVDEIYDWENPGYLTSGLTHKFRYAQDLYLSASVSFQKYSLRYGVTPFFVPNKN
ncbi:MAG: hypothetical protein ACI94Y_003206 [Maribacter sp.]|jgi:hypothetical protein